MSFAQWLPVFAVCLMGAMSPGPSLAVVLRNTTNGSRWHGIVTGLSHCIGIGIYAVAVTTGLVVLITETPSLFRVITWGGAAYLAWLGYKSFTAPAVSGDLTSDNNGTPKLTVTEAARQGFLISFLNPKIAVFFIALFSQFVIPGAGIAYQSILALTAVIVDGAWYALVAVTISQPHILKHLRMRTALINKVTGVILVVIATNALVS
ncbi:LysE family translocator [Sansalvadorimonas sp. 2012CJ34-2]|uniref:LysE family translocator n=1 Tax=Parendozoicomonas callyspongiae TaxID=2942213 RepID=A0ABT0PD46_9GAMM|nr:LysE family translocator [Sansalvadorimonas sp. 2012CJ34-2]MCL6269146.1 LysE family translocator [Sansalvadorimonas sp. 2012CJ34-2]